MFTIQVVSRNTGKPLKSKKVAFESTGIQGGFSSDRTDSNGEVHFSTPRNKGRLFVNGSLVYEGKVQGRRVVYV